MKKSNIIGLIAAITGIAAIVSVISWFLIKDTPVILQGQAEVKSYKVSSKISGRIEQMLVKEGQTVKKGDLLYVLGTPELDAKLRQAKAVQAAAGAQERKALAGARVQEIEAALSMLQKAEAGLSLAEKSYNRAKNLYDQGVIPAQKYDEAKANYDASLATVKAAKAQYDIAVDGARKEDKAAAAALVEQAEGAVSEVESYVRDAFVYSPIDGEISSIIAEQGELTGTGYPVVTVLDTNDIWISYNIKETLLPKIKEGNRFNAYIPALDKEFEFIVDYIAVQGDFATWSATSAQGSFDIRTFNVKTRPVSHIDGLRAGMSAIVNWNEL